MPVYTEILSDDEIMRVVSEKYKRVLIIGCGACTNESLAYKCGYPIFKIKDDEKVYPYATFTELKRIQILLEERGYDVSIKYYEDIDGFFCMKDINRDDYVLEWTQMPDVILCLCCPCGIAGLRKVIDGIPLVGISRLKGVLSYSYRDIEGAREIVFEKSKAFILGDNYV